MASPRAQTVLRRYAALLLLAAMGIFGAVRLLAADKTVANVKLGSAQPNLQQDVRHYAARRGVKYLTLSDRASGPVIDRRARRRT